MTLYERVMSVVDEECNGGMEGENDINFMRGSKIASATFTKRKFVNKIKLLAEKYPDDYKIIKENADGSILAYFPVTDIHISHRKGSRVFTEEQRAAVAERLRLARLKKQDMTEEEEA